MDQKVDGQTVGQLHCLFVFLLTDLRHHLYCVAIPPFSNFDVCSITAEINVKCVSAHHTKDRERIELFSMPPQHKSLG